MDKIKQVEEYLQTCVNNNEIPGASFAYIADKDYFGYVGYKSLIPNKELVDEDTLYDMASCSKVISTTTCALQLIEKGYFSLDSKLSDILIDFPHTDVTIKDIMAHTSGIVPDDKEYKKYMGKKEIWKFFKDKPLQFKPGEKVEYSDFGYVALGFAIEHFVGNLKEYATENIFKPLKMNNTMYQPSDKLNCVAEEDSLDRGLIRGEVHDGKAFRLNGISGNAGVFSNVKDLARFVRMMLNNGEYEGARILKPETIALLNNSYTEGLNRNRTLGWLINDPENPVGDYASKHYLFHTGFTGTSIYIDLDRKLGIVLLTNRIHPSRNNDKIKTIRNEVHNILLRGEN